MFSSVFLNLENPYASKNKINKKSVIQNALPYINLDFQIRKEVTFTYIVTSATYIFTPEEPSPEDYSLITCKQQ